MTTVKQVNLVDVGKADHGKGGIDGNLGAGFLVRLPACGSSNSAIELTCEELYELSEALAWVDVCKGWRPEEQG